MKSPIQGYPIKIPTSMIQRDKNPWNMVLNGESFPTRPGIGGEFFAINFEDNWKNYKAISGYPGPKEVPNKEVNNEEE